MPFTGREDGTAEELDFFQDSVTNQDDILFLKLNSWVICFSVRLVQRKKASRWETPLVTGA